MLPPKPVLEVRRLDVRFAAPTGPVHVVRNVGLRLEPGTTLCLVGESGCGKSTTLLALAGLLPAGASTHVEDLRMDGLRLETPRQVEALRGRRIGMVFQDPLTAFNPTLTIGRQLEEVHLRHMRAGRPAARAKAVDLLQRVGVTAPESRLAQYPHELSGGLRQRVMIAMALMCDPVLLLADEPTTALDVTVQAQVLHLLKRLQHELGIAIVFVTHDLGVVAAMADRVAVMYAGEVVEEGTVHEVLGAPAHPYTRALLACVPQAQPSAQRRLGSIPGRVPSLAATTAGCSFRGRCPDARAACAHVAVPLSPHGSGRSVRCVHQPVVHREAA